MSTVDRNRIIDLLAERGYRDRVTLALERLPPKVDLKRHAETLAFLGLNLWQIDPEAYPPPVRAEPKPDSSKRHQVKEP